MDDKSTLSLGNPERIAHGKRVKAAAGAMLTLMAGLYIFCRSYQDVWPWLVWPRAFAEAGMVGGLADWFAVTALFRHPLGLPIPHTAVIPREKERIGRSLANFVRGNFLTAERVCNQVRELRLVPRLATWIARPENAKQSATRLTTAVPTLLDTLENHHVHTRISRKVIGQLQKLDPSDLVTRLIAWLLDGQRGRQVLAPLLSQMAHTLESSKQQIETAAGDKAPLQRIPLLGHVFRAIAEDFSGRTTGNVSSSMLEASKDTTHPLWDWIEQQLESARKKIRTDEEIRDQLAAIVHDWLDDPSTEKLTDSLWQQLRTALATNLSQDNSEARKNIADVLAAMGQTVENDPKVATKAETMLVDALGKILDKQGTHLETMIRKTIEEWDVNTLTSKLEEQVGPDLQYIRINGTLIGGLVGLTLHAVGTLIW